ncbi:hypothetical protein C2W62_54265, partial [Candidatus Entotheonella serta]
METEIEAGKSTLDERRQKEAGLRRTAGDLESSIAAYTEQIDIRTALPLDQLGLRELGVNRHIGCSRGFERLGISELGAAS